MNGKEKEALPILPLVEYIILKSCQTMYETVINMVYDTSYMGSYQSCQSTQRCVPHNPVITRLGLSDRQKCKTTN